MGNMERVTAAIAAFVKESEELRQAAEEEGLALPNTIVFELEADEEGDDS